MTCWRRLRDWARAGVWHRLHTVLLEHLQAAGKIDWRRASLDSASVPAKGGGEVVGPNPVDRGKSGSKRHLLVDRNGVPLAICLTAANVHDSEVFEEVLEAAKPIRRHGRGRPCARPAKLHADKAYDIPRCRRYLRQRGIGCRIARKGLDSSEKLGRYRWVVERTLAWLARFRRLVVRYERLAGLHLALLDLACALVCFRSLHNMERSASS
jgi:transposase